MELPLTCDLFLPGMTPLHRAGLGGLASTLQWIDKAIPVADRPPGQWTIDERSVTFVWESPNEAKALFEKLFALAFQLKDRLIYLPGQYGELPPPLEVQAMLHEGLILSFYDHGPTSRGSGNAEQHLYEIDDKPVLYSYRPLSWYKHQRDGGKLFLQSLKKEVEITRTLLPGTIQRHAAFRVTQVTHSARLALPLLFAPVGIIALKAGGKRVNDRGKRRFKSGAALLVPDLHNLSRVRYLLPALLPKNARDCQVANVADAVLQAELRLRSRDLLDPDSIPTIRCVWCCPTDWNSRLQPPSFVTEVHLNAVDAKLDQFEVAMRALTAPSPRKNERTGEYFWPRSRVRPLVANNLASGRPWYAGFAHLMTAQDAINNNPIRKYLHLERKGLHTMAQEIHWEHPGEETIIRAVHEALRNRYGRIASENTNNPVARRNRIQHEYERQRLAFAGAKTADAVRHALADLWSRARSNKALQETWPRILPMLTNEKWQLTRDLALIALASYQGKGQEDIDSTEVDDAQDTEETEE